MKNALVKRYAREASNNQKLLGLFRGYYLVHSSGRYFISKTKDVEALESMCDKVLTKSDFDYWIDYSSGADTDGKPAWSNIDYTDDFI